MFALQIFIRISVHDTAHSSRNISTTFTFTLHISFYVYLSHFMYILSLNSPIPSALSGFFPMQQKYFLLLEHITRHHVAGNIFDESYYWHVWQHVQLYQRWRLRVEIWNKGEHLHGLEQIPATTGVTDSTPHHGCTQDAEPLLWEKRGQMQNIANFVQYTFYVNYVVWQSHM